MTPETLLDLFVLAPIGVVEVDSQGRVEIANLAARRLLDPFTQNGSFDDLFQALGTVAPDLGARARAFEASRGVVVEGLELIAPDGQRGVYLALVKVADGRFVAIAADASTLAQARVTTARLDQQLRAIDGALRDYALFTVSPAGAIDTWNSSAERVHQWSAADIVGQPLTMLLPDSGNNDSHVRDTLALAERNGWCEEEGFRARHDGSTFWANTVITALRGSDGAVSAFSVVTRDLSERRKLEDASREDASSKTDYLTGVATRRAFFDVAGAEVSRGRRYSQPLSLLLVEADKFRELAETHGEEFTNEWLRALAWVCRQESRTTDVVGRVGGEEFAVLLPSTELSGGLVLAERIRERMQRHVFHGAFQAVRCTVSVGVAELSDNITSVDGLLSASGTAVERARQAGRNLVVGYDA
jgi:diguanylate cyclase (GGDEF)-like protein/PAS domain S-box-containing protein